MSEVTPTETRQRLQPGQRETPVLEVRRLSKRFSVGGMFTPKYVHALEDVSFTIGYGEIVALVGESGSGKSTTARLLARLTPPTEGEILFKGEDIIKAEPRVAELPQQRADDLSGSVRFT